MAWPNWCRAAAGILVVAVLAGPRPAGAMLIAIDLPGGNPDEVTRDTASGLDWLDLTETAGLAFIDALAFANASFGSGWRHATGLELCSLFATYALDPACSGTPVSGHAQDTTPGPFGDS